MPQFVSVQLVRISPMSLWFMGDISIVNGIITHLFHLGHHLVLISSNNHIPGIPRSYRQIAKKSWVWIHSLPLCFPIQYSNHQKIEKLIIIFFSRMSLFDLCGRYQNHQVTIGQLFQGFNRRWESALDISTSSTPSLGSAVSLATRLEDEVNEVRRSKIWARQKWDLPSGYLT